MTTESGAGESGITDSCAETVRIRVLPGSAQQRLSSSDEPSEKLPQRGFDPYNNDLGPLGPGSGPRRSSEPIVRRRSK